MAEFDGWTPEGFQVRTIRRPEKETPWWAGDEKNLRWKILGPSLRRYRIAYLYWCCGLSSADVAEEMGISVKAVNDTIYKLLHAKGRV